MGRDRMAKACGSALLALLLISGCRPEAQDASDIHVKLELSPSPPVVGPAEISLQLTDAGGAAVQGADVQLEGNMNHAGMKPSFAALEETDAGRYHGTLDFTMGGDWFILVTAALPDGRSVERKIDVPGVKTR